MTGKERLSGQKRIREVMRQRISLNPCTVQPRSIGLDSHSWTPCSVAGSTCSSVLAYYKERHDQHGIEQHINLHSLYFLDLHHKLLQLKRSVEPTGDNSLWVCPRALSHTASDLISHNVKILIIPALKNDPCLLQPGSYFWPSVISVCTKKELQRPGSLGQAVIAQETCVCAQLQQVQKVKVEAERQSNTVWVIILLLPFVCSSK